MAVMLFIQAVQLLHTHPSTGISASLKKNAGFAIVKPAIEAGLCAVCDFHYLKDKDFSTFLGLVAPLVVNTILFIDHNTSLVSVRLFDLTGRGPPVRA